MWHIQKGIIPQFFITDTQGLTNWNQYLAEKKRNIRRHILQTEQHELCCYCEGLLNISSSDYHLEHIVPQNVDPNLIFNYINILVSCDGKHFNKVSDTSVSSCGHRKDRYYDRSLFLNPVVVTNIENHFKYNKDTGLIKPSDLDKTKATYTILLLNLNGNNDTLARARIIAKNSIVNLLKTIVDDNQKILILQTLLSKDNLAFRTFIRSCFKI
jgi:uncharacterized protein (TIGR02646 family)